MNNERIDLTQFDNITSYPDGGWEVPEEDNLSKTLVADLDGSLVCSTSAMAQIEGYSLEEAQRFATIIAQLPNIVAELKRCYELIDSAQGNVPYVEHCEECGATDGGDAEGCDYCGIIHYESNPRGFYHKDSPKRYASQ